LCGIVRNLAIDQLRRSRNEPRPGSETPAVREVQYDARHPGQDYSPDPAEELSRRERHETIAAALDSLDEISRSAVVLRYYDGLSSKQIGDLLDLAPAAVDMRLTRARRVLRDRLGPAELAPGVGK
jgi:RNA polymerase sigma factor (sigma-70 family)